MRSSRGRPPYPDPVTPAEQKVLELLRAGLTNAEIAVRLGISINTVRYHVSNLLSKAGTSDRHGLARWHPEPRSARRWRWSLAIAHPGLLAAGAAVVAVAFAAGGVLSIRDQSPFHGAVDAFDPARYDVAVYAGSGEFGSEDGDPFHSSFRDPRGIAVDPEGNVYVTELWSACVRRILPSGPVETLTWTRDADVAEGDSCEISVRYGAPAIAWHDDRIFTFRGRLWIFRPGDQPGSVGGMGSPPFVQSTATGLVPVAGSALAFAPGDHLYISDRENHRVVRVELAPGQPVREPGGLTPFAGFNLPWGLAVADDGSIIVADGGSAAIRRLSPSGGVSLVAGGNGRTPRDGPALEAAFSDPTNLAFDGDGNLWISDRLDGSIRVLTVAGEVVTVITGLSAPEGLAIDSAGDIYVAESGENRILRISRAP